MSDLEPSLPASPQRRAGAREQGYIARSAAMTGAFALITAAAMAVGQGTSIIEGFGDHLRGRLQTAPSLVLNQNQATDLIRDDATAIVLSAGWIIGAAWAAALAINLLQTGFIWSTATITPDWTRIDPGVGSRRLFSADNVASVFWGNLVVFAIAAGAMIAVQSGLGSFGGTPQSAVGPFSKHALERVSWSALGLTALLIVLATVDVAWRRWRLEQSLRMSTDEARDEAGRRRSAGQSAMK
jgi:flagellar biosynthetic protein FlhB